KGYVLAGQSTHDHRHVSVCIIFIDQPWAAKNGRNGGIKRHWTVKRVLLPYKNSLRKAAIKGQKLKSKRCKWCNISRLTCKAYRYFFNFYIIIIHLYREGKIQ